MGEAWDRLEMHKPEEINHLGDQSLDGSITLKWILNK
jgi:hypothetical protein